MSSLDTCAGVVSFYRRPHYDHTSTATGFVRVIALVSPAETDRCGVHAPGLRHALSRITGSVAGDLRDSIVIKEGSTTIKRHSSTRAMDFSNWSVWQRDLRFCNA